MNDKGFKTNLKNNPETHANDIAIIGMACRLPDAKNYADYWENLKNSINSIREIPIDRWDIQQYYSQDPSTPETSVSKWAGLLDDISSFDNQFFHISPREALNMDPQQRLLLEEAWHCIEDAGITAEYLQKNTTSVYVGVMAIDYQQRLANSDEPTDSYACLGNYEGILANRISFYLGLNGESKSIDTACSSSLVALHDAKRSLNIGESEYAFAAGVSVICHPWKYISFSKSRMLSPDGQCKTFDSDADGYVPGEGVGILLLTSLENAVKKGHRIHGILKGTAVNHTGKSTSITAPKVEAQRDVIQAAQESAGIDPEHISYIEAHGTGTSLGDPIEVEGLIQAFHSKKTRYCALGSVKTNIGHLEAAAGVAGVIKVLLMLKHAQLVPTLNIHTINPIIDFEHSPFYLSLETAPWTSLDGEERVAGVSSFGFGGANAHVILAEYSQKTCPKIWHPILDNRQHPFVLSAKTSEGLELLIDQWKGHVKSDLFSHQSMGDIAYTQVHGRESFRHRFALMADGKPDFCSQLLAGAAKGVEILEKNQTGALVLMNCENISPPQWKILCDNYPSLASISKQCYAELNSLKCQSMIKLWEKGEIKPHQKSIFQFLITYTFGQWLLENGLAPSSITGVGVGVLAAAVLSGLMDLSIALRIALNKEKKIVLNHHTPKWAFSAPFLKEPIEPLSVSADYCLRLRQIVALDEDELTILLDKSSLLIKNQFTFKQYIAEWEPALSIAKIDIYKILGEGGSAPDTSAQKIILLMALAVCYKKLSQKWNLSEKIKLSNPAVSEIIDLILDDALPYEMAVELLHPETPTTHLDFISKQLIASKHHLNKTKPYALLRQHTKLLTSITLTQWQALFTDEQKDQSLAFFRESLHDKLTNIQIGSGLTLTDRNFTKLRNFVLPALQIFILELWKRGALSQLNHSLLPLQGHTISLPTYPFSKKQFMITSQNELPLQTVLEGHSFSKRVKKDEFFMADHVILNQKIFPAAGYIEMAHASGSLIHKEKAIMSLRNIFWPMPLILNSDFQDLQITVNSEKNLFRFEIHDENLGVKRQIFAQGFIEFDEKMIQPASEKMEELQALFQEVISETEFYAQLYEQGYHYGPTFQTAQWVKIAGNKALAKIALPREAILLKNEYDFYLHPSLLDAGFQVAVSLLLRQNLPGPLFPTALSETIIYQPLPSELYVYVHLDSANQKCRIQFLSIIGEVLVDMRGCMLRGQRQAQMPNLRYIHPVYENRSLILNDQWATGFSKDNAIIVLDDNDQRSDELKKLFSLLKWGDNFFQLKYADINSQSHHFKNILGQYVEKNIRPNYFINLLALGANGIQEEMDRGLLILFELNQALMQMKIKGEIRILHVFQRPESSQFYALQKMALGFSKTLRQENPKYRCKVLSLEKLDLTILRDELLNDDEVDFIRYHKGERQTESWHSVSKSFSENSKIHIRKQGVYLITGGLGGLGFIVAQYLARHYSTKLVLCGRAPLDSDKENQLATLRSLGAEVIYFVTDVSSLADVKKLIASTLETYGTLQGIFHSAGILRDAYILNQKHDDFLSVLLPKIKGALNLDEASSSLPLDFFILFSSLSSCFGNLGQSDYASANSFLNDFAACRNNWIREKSRSGHTLSINWPLWDEGGMQVDAAAKLNLSKILSSQSLSTSEGIKALEHILPLKLDAVGVQKPNLVDTQKSEAPQPPVENFATLDLPEKTQNFLKILISDILKSEASEIKAKAPFENYGIDSVIILELNQALEKHFGPLPKTLFFEYHNLAELTNYFLTEQKSMLEEFFGESKTLIPTAIIPEAPIIKNASEPNSNMDIAIIGVSGRYPQARNIEQFWENLKAGRDCVIEIPESRWNHDLYPTPKWGGFLDDFDRFDPLFFNISPKEAELIDPQERLFLETAWGALEDAAHTPESLKGNVGVFVGVMYGQYQLYGVERSALGNTDITPSSLYASIANRVSYFCNFHGPSMAVDTMCSSSLTALHLACDSLRKNECQVALAGGVNISSHPNKYLYLTQAHFLSSDGKCRSFGEGGDGYVPGEGVGAVLLKPLDQALKDKDHIYAIIKSTALNHGGKTHGYTVPNPNAQGALVSEALKKSGINPRSLNYLETHGTGTSLGDPIEIRGLSKAFSEYTSDKQFCPIGSVKSNVGHLESAAGMVALTKVLLQLKYKMLVPSLHSETLNSNIDFSQTPFYVQQKLEEWKAPYPKHVGISSFGAGGSNAHVIIEEAPPQIEPKTPEKNYYLITLSAKEEACLEKKISDLSKYLQESTENVANISYSLNVGRVHHNYRWACVINSSQPHALPEKYFKNTVSTEPLEKNPIYNNTAEALETLAELYTKGFEINWELLHQNDPKYRISLPIYPFLKERYWVPELKQNPQVTETLHPLIDINISTFESEKFQKKLDNKAFYLKDHIINGQIVLPGTAYLEMIQAAGTLASTEKVQHIRDLFWMRLLAPKEQNQSMTVQLEPTDDGASFKIFSKNQEENVIHAKGWLDYKPETKPEPLNFEAIKNRCEWMGEKAWIYERYKALGYDYGESFQNTSALWCNETEALAKLQLSNAAKHDFEAYTLHPTLMDSALRTTLGIAGKLRSHFDLAIPFYLEKLSIFQKVPEMAWVYAKLNHSTESTTDLYYDIVISDENGNVCVTISRFNVRVLEAEKSLASEVYVYQPIWHAQSLPLGSAVFNNGEPLLLISDDPDFVIDRKEFSVIKVLLSDEYQKINDHSYKIQGNKPEDFLKLWNEVSSFSQKPTHILQVLTSAFSETSTALNENEWHAAQTKTFLPLIFLFQAIEKKGPHQSIQFSYVYHQSEGAIHALHEAMGSFSNAIKIINPNFILKTIEFPSKIPFDIEILLHEVFTKTSERIRYNETSRYVRKWAPLGLSSVTTSQVPIKAGGVYLITGGIGGLGNLFAEFFAKNYQAKLILTGRSPLNPTSQSQLETLKKLGSDVLYLQTDVSNFDSVAALIEQIKNQWGHLDGIIHSAGVAAKTPLKKVQAQEFESGLSAKIYGTYYLDYLTKTLPLDFFITFSSVSAYLGDFGIGSYSYGNAFMDSYLSWRDQECKEKRRSGISLSFGWPYWESGGMKLSAEELAIYHDYSGLDLLSSEQGLDYFLRALTNKAPNLIMVPGDREKIEKSLGIRKTATAKTMPLPAAITDSPDISIVNYLKKILAEVTKLPLPRIDAEVELSQYGVDSVMIIDINQQLLNYFPDIRQTLLFEHKTLKSLAQYLQATYPEQLQKMPGSTSRIQAEPPKILPAKMFKRFKKAELVTNQNELSAMALAPIAIIGISGRYPEAENLEQFWENLQSGKDCIREIPSERWDYGSFYQPEKTVPGKSCSKWGGFIKDADKFDPLYFNISPREAESMDPQERLMLEMGLTAIEDAGYSVELLHEKAHGEVGVFVGLMWNEYQLLNAKSSENAQEIIYGSSNNSAISNRISYAFDFHGPSLVVDTACSSSLVAIHLACENIRSGACQYAIAGGVNLSLHPSKYVNMSTLGMLSTDGRCRSFGEGGGRICAWRRGRCPIIKTFA